MDNTVTLPKFSVLGGLRMNTKKTECMVIRKDTSQRPLPENRTANITVEGNPIEQVTEITYLGGKFHICWKNR